jgi:hypothetical protein
MSFARQVSICRRDDQMSVKPTEEELSLSRLKRPGMHGDNQIRQVLLPGKYALDPAADEPWIPTGWHEPEVTVRRAASIRRPRLIRMENVAWQQSQEFVWTARHSTKRKTISIPIDFADDAGLGYYGCRALSSNDVISLNHRSIITNFCYGDDYFQDYVLGVLGSWSIEQHEFAHVDTPLDDRSGFLVLGRVDSADQALEMTAFVVPPGLSVYIPAQTIHTNDYLLGTWETLLSSSCEFPSAQLKQSKEEPQTVVHGTQGLPWLLSRDGRSLEVW